MHKGLLSCGPTPRGWDERGLIDLRPRFLKSKIPGYTPRPTP